MGQVRFTWTRQKRRATYPSRYTSKEKIMSDESMKTLYSGNLGIYYGQFYFDIADEDEDEDEEKEDEEYIDLDLAFKNHENGICGSAQAGKLFFVVGIQDGTISIAVELHQSKPPVDDSFDEIVEVSFQRGNTPVSLCEWGNEGTHKLDLPPGSYRVRYYIDGMDKDYENDEDGDAPIPDQRHLIQIWSCVPEQDKIIKHTSETAAYWHHHGSAKDCVVEQQPISIKSNGGILMKLTMFLGGLFGGNGYFYQPVASPAACLDDQCPCNHTPIQEGEGYLYISEGAVEFRRDARSERALQSKAEKYMQSLGEEGTAFFLDPSGYKALLICEQAARQRGLDLNIARLDAKYAWRTSKAPLRATPKV